MNPEDLMSLLPPLPTFEELAQLVSDEAAAADTPTLELITLTDDEFNMARKGTIYAAQGRLQASAAAEAAEAIVAAASGEAASSSNPEITVDAQRSTGIAPLDETALSCYANAAALRYTYRIDCLTPLGADPDEMPPPRYAELQHEQRGQVFAYLTGRSEIMADARGQARWILSEGERRASLKKLVDGGPRTLERAIAQARADARDDAKQSADERTAAQARQLAQLQTEQTETKIEIAREIESYDQGDSGASRVEETLWSYLVGTSAALEAQDCRQLLLSQSVINWLQDLTLQLKAPAPQEVAQQLARETLLQPFRHLTGEWGASGFVSYFTGRETELSRLYDYLAVLPPKSLQHRISRAFKGLVDSAWRLVTREAGHRPVLIHGPGGVGKSTLLAKFLLDHLTTTEPRDRFPYAYLDFDLSTLSALEPVTLLVEAARQLAAEYPASEAAWTAERSKWLETIRRSGPEGVDSVERAQALSHFAALLSQSVSEDATVSQQFARGLPFLLVMDTFEEMQFRDRDAIKDVFRFLNELRKQVPALRCILMGRAPLEDIRLEYRDLETFAVDGDAFGTGEATDFSVIEVLLADLEADKARAYLGEQGVSDPQLADELVAIVGGNPLSLRLIARVLRDGDVDLGSLREEMKWRPSLSDRLLGRKVPPKALLQGVLFRRILGHIHSKKIQDLAHPGLILRRITPQLIQDVLAEPCGLGTLDDLQARNYFDDLAREVSLVSTEMGAGGEPVLRHRPELRRIMLRLMEADETKQEQIRAVNGNAVRYYQTRGDQIGREEALYHRLMLGELPPPEGLLDDVPTEEAVDAGFVAPPITTADPRPIWRALADAVDEMPASASTYLAARLHKELVPDAAWETADPRDWELMILGRASHRARVRDSIISALEGLRRDRQNMLSHGLRLSHFSPLPVMEIALLERLGRNREAKGQVADVLDNLPSEASRFRRVMEYNLLGARIAAHLGDSTACKQGLKRVEKEINRLQNSGDKSDAEVRRGERRLLRFATDCHNLKPSTEVLEVAASCLFRLTQSVDALGDFPVLARYAAGSAISKDIREVHSVPPYTDLFNLVRSPDFLPLLFKQLPSGAVTRVAEALAQWSIEARQSGADAKAFKKMGRLPEHTRDAIKLRDAWKRLVLDRSRHFGNRLVELLKTVPMSTHRLVDLLQALTPEPKRGAAGEDPFNEARHAGDLIPGEGLEKIENPSKSKKRR